MVTALRVFPFRMLPERLPLMIVFNKKKKKKEFMQGTAILLLILNGVWSSVSNSTSKEGRGGRRGSERTWIKLQVFLVQTQPSFYRELLLVGPRANHLHYKVGAHLPFWRNFGLP